jgi:hypothetical protein
MPGFTLSFPGLSSTSAEHVHTALTCHDASLPASLTELLLGSWLMVSSRSCVLGAWSHVH